MQAALLLVSTNIAVIFVLNITMRLLGVDDMLVNAGGGLNFNLLLIFSAVMGFAGSFISLFLSKKMAIRTTGARVIENPSNEVERWLMQTVSRQAEQAGIDMPEVAIYDSPQINAFATGMNKNKALVAVSTGLMNAMSRDEVEAVLAHEVSHAANGDMVTMALIQGVVNTFVVFFARIVGHIVDRLVLKNERGRGIGYWVSSMAAEMLFGVLASIITMWFSRQREFRADAGGAKLASREKMIAALEALRRGHPPQDMPGQLAAFGISGKMKSGIKALFITHPPLEIRIATLRAGA